MDGSLKQDGEFVRPNKDAQDFSEIQELALEEEENIKSDEMEIQLPSPVTLETFSQSMIPSKPVLPTSSLGNIQGQLQGNKNKQDSFDKTRLAQIYSDFKKGKIRFTDIFGPRLQPKPIEEEIIVPDKKSIIKIEDEGYKLAPDARDLFFQESEWIEQDSISNEPNELNISNTVQVDKRIDKSYLPIELDPWESKIIWDPDVNCMNMEIEKGYQKMG